MDKQEIINVFLPFLQWEEQPLKNWYVGITEDYDRVGQKHGTWVEVSGTRKITVEYNHGRPVRR